LKNLVDTWLRQALTRLPESLVPPSGPGGVCIEVERTRDARHGDFASNLAMRLASAANRNPRALAEAIKSALPTDAALAKVEIAGAGFINFFLTEQSYHDEIRRALRDEGDYGRCEIGRGREVTIEVASVEVASIEVASVESRGALHAGHARQAAFGASVAALLEAAGYRVTRECRVIGAGGASAADLAAIRQELAEFGVIFDSWGGEGSPAPPAVSLFRSGRKLARSTQPAERVTLRALRAEVGNDAARLFCVMRGHDQPLLFDLDLARTRSLDNPLYSMQYAHARIVSVQRQIEGRGLKVDAARGCSALGLLIEPAERALMRRVSAFPEVIAQSAGERAPPVLAQYLRGLAHDFHTYYGAHPIVVPDAALRDARVALASAVGVAIRNGLRLLGVAAPDSV
jgi:arginyl-tRNA synthetase